MKPLISDKLILDACCGGKHFWFDKNNPNALFMDIRQVSPGSISLQPNWSVSPDLIGDYRDMNFQDGSFRLVVWDIPHKLKYDSGIITMKYGYLGDTWKDDLLRGFNEIWRVLKTEGVLIFKYSDLDIPVSEMLSIFPHRPLFGTKTKKGVNNTFWFCFMKIKGAGGAK